MNKLQIVTDKICELNGYERTITKAFNGGFKVKYNNRECIIVSLDFSDNTIVQIETVDIISNEHKCVAPSEINLGYNNVVIREAEVLKCLNKIDWKRGFNIHSDDVICDNKTALCEWALGQPLSSQSPETIEFLFTVLNCEG